MISRRLTSRSKLRRESCVKKNLANANAIGEERGRPA